MNLSVTISSPSYEIWFQSVNEWRKYYFVYLYTWSQMLVPHWATIKVIFIKNLKTCVRAAWSSAKFWQESKTPRLDDIEKRREARKPSFLPIASNISFLRPPAFECLALICQQLYFIVVAWVSYGDPESFTKKLNYLRSQFTNFALEKTCKSRTLHCG